jgi:hypothetical protein
VLLLAVPFAGTWMDRDYQPHAIPHVEVPGGPVAARVDHHNHAFCAALASTPVLPGPMAAPVIAAGAEATTTLLRNTLVPVSITLTDCRSRAPPIA